MPELKVSTGADGLTAHTAVATTAVGPFFEELGTRVAERWRLFNLDGSAFSRIAAEELTRQPPSQVMDYGAIIAWVLRSEKLPFQQEFDSMFGQPPVTLFWHPRFYIQALFWTSSTTAVHNHAFSGAFSILAGASLQTVYTFQVQEQVNEHLVIGLLEGVETKVLQKGSSQEILPGDSFIHSAWHLDLPSVTIVVRTHSETNTGPRREFFAPHVAVDPFWIDQQLSRRLQCLQLLESIKAPTYDARAVEVIQSQDFFTAYMVARQYCRHRSADRLACERALGTAINRWPEREKVFAPIREDMVRRAAAMRGRLLLADPQLKLLLGLLLTVRDRRSLLEAFAPHCGASGVATALVEGIRGLSLKGVIPAEIDESGAAWLLDELNTSTGVSDTVPLRSGNSSDHQGLRNATLLQPLFVTS